MEVEVVGSRHGCQEMEETSTLLQQVSTSASLEDNQKNCRAAASEATNSMNISARMAALWANEQAVSRDETPGSMPHHWVSHGTSLQDMKRTPYPCRFWHMTGQRSSHIDRPSRLCDHSSPLEGCNPVPRPIVVNARCSRHMPWMDRQWLPSKTARLGTTLTDLDRPRGHL